jgi:hypothetical protein
VALVLGDDFLAGAVATDPIRVVPLAAHQAIPRRPTTDIDRARRQSVALVVRTRGIDSSIIDSSINPLLIQVVQIKKL